MNYVMFRIGDAAPHQDWFWGARFSAVRCHSHVSWLIILLIQYLIMVVTSITDIYVHGYPISTTDLCFLENLGSAIVHRGETSMLIWLIIALIRRLGVRVPLESRHFLSQKLWHFYKNIRSCVENECCCPHTVYISNVNVTSKISILP